MNTIGETIKKLRGAKGITQEELAEAVNISYQAVSKWENGGYGNYPCKQIWHYCKLLQRQKSSGLEGQAESKSLRKLLMSKL